MLDKRIWQWDLLKKILFGLSLRLPYGFSPIHSLAQCSLAPLRIKTLDHLKEKKERKKRKIVGAFCWSALTGKIQSWMYYNLEVLCLQLLLSFDHSFRKQTKFSIQTAIQIQIHGLIPARRTHL